MSITRLTSSNQREFLEANSDSLVIIFFDAAFTGQGTLIDEATRAVLESDELKAKTVVCMADVEENNELASEFSVLSVPTVVCRYKGQVVRKIDTIESARLVTSIREELNRLSLVAEQPQGDECASSFREYLKKLTTRAPIMVFMKGDAKMPRCGFSKQLVKILEDESVKYESFDILNDEDVRQGLKAYSDWPTYPQVYVKGEFIGGLDIIKELQNGGELRSTLSV